MAKYELDEVAHKNLIVFLSRCDLKGSEVGEFNKIMLALSKPVVDPEKCDKAE